MPSTKVFNIGLPKTGTTSLNSALCLLGYRSFHSPRWIRDQVYLNATASGGPNDWDAITNSCENFYPLIDWSFPGSKFIYTTRPLDEWLKSCARFHQNPSPLAGGKDPLYHRRVFTEIFKSEVYDESHFKKIYRWHEAGVKEYFSDGTDLLILPLEAENKWELLCDFLGKKCPPTKYPKKNVRRIAGGR